MAPKQAMRDDRLVDTADLRNRPVVLESGAPEDQPRRRLRPRTIIGVSSATVLAAIGLVAGSWSIWSAVSTNTPAGPPAPLWFSPPAPVVTPNGGAPASSGTSTDDHGGDRAGHGSGSGSDGSGHSSATTRPVRPTANTTATGLATGLANGLATVPATAPPPSGHSGPGRGGVAPTSSAADDEDRSGKGRG